MSNKQKKYTKERRGRILQDHLAQHGGKLDEDVFIEAASDPDHPAHDYFCWDREKNHQMALRAQVRAFVHGIQIKHLSQKPPRPMQYRDIVVNPPTVSQLPALVTEGHKRVYVQSTDAPDAMLADLRIASVSLLSTRRRAMFTALGLDKCVRRLELNLQDIDRLASATSKADAE